MKIALPIVLSMLLTGIAYAADLSSKTLSGKWTFTHMILDGEKKVPVNLGMEFLPSGELINYSQGGAEKSRANYVIDQGVIHYTDKRDPQRWEVKQFDGDTLIVDHKGAEMFFTRP